MSTRLLSTRLIAWSMLLFFVSLSTGCMTTRGVMYLGKKRVKDHLKDTADQEPKPKTAAPAAKDKKDDKGKKADGKDKKADGKADKADKPAAAPVADKSYQARLKDWKRRRELMKSIPEGREALGGFCVKPKIREMLNKIDAQTKTCRATLDLFTNKANTQGKIFWSLLGVGLVLTAGSVISLVIEDKTVSNGVGLGLGITGALTIAAVPIGGFDARQERYKERGKRLDNYMWSLRRRIGKEVCNATSLEMAVKKLEPIIRRTRELCDGKNPDDGLYRLPD